MSLYRDKCCDLSWKEEKKRKVPAGIRPFRRLQLTPGKKVEPLQPDHPKGLCACVHMCLHTCECECMCACVCMRVPVAVRSQPRVWFHGVFCWCRVCPVGFTDLLSPPPIWHNPPPPVLSHGFWGFRLAEHPAFSLIRLPHWPLIFSA